MIRRFICGMGLFNYLSWRAGGTRQVNDQYCLALKLSVSYSSGKPNFYTRQADKEAYWITIII